MIHEPFEYETVLDICSVDFTGHWQPGAVFRTLQQASDGHCHVLELTFEKLREQGLAWVLSRAHLEAEEYPVLGQRVKVRTWPGKTRHMFFPRYFTFEADGREMGRACMVFLLMDLETRRIAAPARLGREIPAFDLPSLPFPGNLRPMQAAAARSEHQPVYTDLDMNQHVNNTRYIDWFMNQIPVEWHRTHMLGDLLIHYNAEVTPGEALTLEMSEQDGLSLMRGLHGDTVCFGVQGTWAERR